MSSLYGKRTGGSAAPLRLPEGDPVARQSASPDAPGVAPLGATVATPLRRRLQCRQQIAHGTGRRALHLAEVLRLGLREAAHRAVADASPHA